MQALAREEGFYVKGSRACRNNNPGNLDFEPWQEHQFGAVLETCPAGETPRFAKFPSADAGFAAMRVLLSGSYTGLSFAEAIAKWAPPSDGNNDGAYCRNVCAWTEQTPDTVLDSQLIG